MRKKKTLMKLTTMAVALLMLLSVLYTSCFMVKDGTDGSVPLVQLFDGEINTGIEKYFDSSVIYQLPDTVKADDIISVIVRTDSYCLLDAYNDSKSNASFGEYAFSEAADAFQKEILRDKAEILADLDASELSYQTGADYSVVMSGFELVITAKDFEAVCKTIGNRGTTIVGEVYNVSETKLVENKVSVYETGIFDSSDFEYDGTGMVVAVLDTGLDYYHTAFSINNFTADISKLGLTFEDVEKLVGDTKASKLQGGLTASDVFVNQKVPFGFDYADRDSDVYPIQSHHGTHVSGIIAGKDDVITGVAPNAQLVEMKIFSDTALTARTSWILNALEDCVVLGVDIINMSIGTSCGFSRATDAEAISGVYDRIREQGISMTVASSNSFNSTYGSEKNGNLGLTSNPDSATVGSPSTYEGALSVASISGKKTPYMLYNEKIIYFVEATNRVAEEKNFFEDILKDGQDSVTAEYVTIPGAGRSADYTGMDVTGKIVLVERGSTSFEEKANVAQEKGALGIIIYNNVSGDIKMNVGDAKLAVCSIGQDDGEMLAKAGSGVLKISVSQTSGPFISDFSSWGPSPSLGIKPEITAHGGSIYSAVPGQSYDYISGTSMATPNISGLIALLRQYIVDNIPSIKDDNVAINRMVNRLMMSTADIIINKNGLPYAVRKQGAGLANLVNCATTTAYIQTYDRVTGEVMDKTKIELGDDPSKTGVYTLKFSVVNMGDSSLTYDMDYYVMTEGVSNTLTSDGKTTVTEEGYALSGASVVISKVSGGTQNGTQITVAAGATADVTVTVKLSDADKKYLDDSFENGMYVEGYIVLNAVSGTEVDLNVPYLAFYGDWTVAPLFDLDYYATNKDELDDSIDLLDKTLPDAYATRPIGGLYDDYVNYLGSYYFQQNPSAVKIAADRKYISLSNQEESINSLRFVWAGLLRNASRVEVTITEDATGEVVFETVDKDVRKSYGDGGPIAPANIDIDFSASEYNLKNNTAYTVKLKGYLDYGDGGADTNLSNTFEFPLVTDFLAPAVTGCEFYTEYDKTEKITRYYAKIAVYDNHYSMGMHVGYLDVSDNEYALQPFDAYVTPIYSEFNSTTNVVYELTDHIQDLRQGVNPNSFMLICYDYAMNQSTYEINLPDEFVDVWLEEEEIVLSPNQVYTLNLNAYPYSEWGVLAEEIFSSNTSVARIVNDKIVAVAPGESSLTVRFNNSMIKVKVRVLGEEDEGFVSYDQPVADKFHLSGYYVDKAYYFLNTDEREIGKTEDERLFSGNDYSLSMFPSESVTLRYKLDAYFPNATSVVFESSNDKLVKVDQNGTIVAVAEGFASVSVKVLMNGKTTYYSETINIEIKDPFITMGASLSHYFGNGGFVSFPPTLAITEIGQFAFSNYDYVLKGPEDEISEEVPELSKIWFIGDNTIEEVVIPEGVETIGAYAFANLTALKKVVLPTTLEKIDYGAFYGCTSLQTVEGLENVKFINQDAFANCALKGTIKLDSAIAVSNNAFAGNKRIKEVVFTKQIQSIGSYAFRDNTALERILERADGKTGSIVLSAKLGTGVFMNCTSLTEISINSAVIPAATFDGCKALTKVTLGSAVAVIGEYAFRATEVTSFTVENGNTVFYPQNDKPYLLNADGTEILLIAPATAGELVIDDDRIVSIANNAAAGNKKLTSVIAPSVTKVGNYAFADCTRLKTVQLGALTAIGDYAFYNTSINVLPSFASLGSIGAYSFSCTKITSVAIPDGMTVGRGAFQECKSIASVTVGDGAVIGADAFRLDKEYNFTEGHSYVLENGKKVFYYEYTSPLTSLTIGENVTIGSAAFKGAAVIEHIELGAGAKIGAEAFYNACSLKSIDLSAVISIGDRAFSGDIIYDFSDGNYSVPAMTDDGNYIYRFFAPDLTRVDLSSLTKIGENAFAYCLQLSEVVLGNDLTEIADFAFDGCKELSSIDLSNVKKIGSNSFTGTKLQALTLTNAVSIDSYAFANIGTLISVALGDGEVTIGEGAFASCAKLATVSNMKNVVSLGDYAFAKTAIVSADLSSATYIGEQAFLKDSFTDFTVVIGDCLENIGDNPFAMCHLVPFSTTVTETANGKDYVNELFTFDINDKIRVINGSLYRVVPKGLELIAYAGTDTDVTVADNTVRIAAMAFAGTNVSKVVLPYTVASIGHKAFFGCKDLKLVSFNSYKAPILEEEYDITYFITGQNLPATGEYEFAGHDGSILIYEGLGVVPYFMWNVSDLPSNIYYGANFVDYIGHGDGDLVMVCPVNGLYYDSFVLNQYFGLHIDGAAAADEITLAAILAINNLPEKITLADKALVEFARAAYDKISTHEQRALVTNYDKLVQAEKRIKDLEYLNQQDKPEDPAVPEGETAASLPIEIILCIVFGAATAVLLSLSVVLLVLLKKSKKAVAGGNPSVGTVEDAVGEGNADGEEGVDDAPCMSEGEENSSEQQTESEKSEADESHSDEETNG